MFFQINYIETSETNKSDAQRVDIKLSDIERIGDGIGRIFIANNYISNYSDFTVILTSPVPPMIYEITIKDSNPVLRAQQAIKSEDSKYHFYGEDFVAATNSYIALLVYDRKAWQYCITILNRKDHSSGHSIIPLNDHVNRITGMMFICSIG